jgi:hypothetical protein
LKHSERAKVKEAGKVKDIGDGYLYIGISKPINLSLFSLTILSPRFTDWLAVGCETPSFRESFMVLMPSSRAAR